MMQMRAIIAAFFFSHKSMPAASFQGDRSITGELRRWGCLSAALWHERQPASSRYIGKHAMT